MTKNPPEKFPQIIPYLYYEDAAPAVDFIQDVFGFEVETAFRDPESNRLLHATIRVGSGVIFVGPGMEEFQTRGNSEPAWATSMTYVFIDNVDKHYEKAVKGGATVLAEPAPHFGGNRQYSVVDPYGQRWTFAQPIDGAS